MRYMVDDQRVDDTSSIMSPYRAPRHSSAELATLIDESIGRAIMSSVHRISNST